MAELKTKKNDDSVERFLASVEDEEKRSDSIYLCKMFQDITGAEPKMWGDAIVGFGDYHYKYASGREGDWPESAFSPRKASLTIYIMTGFGRYEDLLDKLGKFTTSKACLYIKKLSDVDTEVLRQLVARSVEDIRAGKITL